MTSALNTLLRDVQAGHRLTPDEGEYLMKTTGRDVFRVTAAADEVREEKVGDIVTYVRNQNLHVTNICKNLCGFCGFGKKATDPGAYCQDLDATRAGCGWHRNAMSPRSVSSRGSTPRLTSIPTPACSPRCTRSPLISTSTRSARTRWPMRQREASAPRQRFLPPSKIAGLGSLQGTAAEILIESVRKVICPRKVSGAEWERIIREAHAMGIRTSATIMYGSYESARDQVDHMAIVREIQDDTHGFSEFIPMSYIHTNTPLYTQGVGRAGATGREDLLMIAVSRLFLDNFNNVQVSWGKLGPQDDAARAPVRG